MYRVFRFFLLVLIIALVTNVAVKVAFDTTDEGNFNDYLPVILLPVFALLVWIGIRRAAKTTYEKNKRFFTGVTYTFGYDSLIAEGENFTTAYNWDEFVKIKETDNWYLLYRQKIQAVPIKKSSFNADQKEEVNRLFRSLQSKIKVSLK